MAQLYGLTAAEARLCALLFRTGLLEATIEERAEGTRGAPPEKPLSTKAVLRIRRDADAALAEMGKRFTAAWKAGRSSAHVFTFESPAALFRVLTPKRWELVEQLQAVGPVSVRGLARALDRDVKRVHEDVGVLIEVGLIEKTARGEIRVPYAVIEADFALRAA